MAQVHMVAAQPFRLHPVESSDKALTSISLFKSKDLQVMQVMFSAKSALPLHQVPGEITIQCIEGVVDVVLEDSTVPLSQGELMFLSRGQRHAVKAQERANIVVTIALHGT